VEVELDAWVAGYGVAWLPARDRLTGEWDDWGVGGRASCWRWIWAASISTDDVPAARDAALRFDNWCETESEDVGPYKNVVTSAFCNAMICAWSATCDTTVAWSA
jgi:hypothetical protein